MSVAFKAKTNTFLACSTSKRSCQGPSHQVTLQAAGRVACRFAPDSNSAFMNPCNFSGLGSQISKTLATSLTLHRFQTDEWPQAEAARLEERACETERVSPRLCILEEKKFNTAKISLCAYTKFLSHRS